MLQTEACSWNIPKAEEKYSLINLHVRENPVCKTISDNLPSFRQSLYEFSNNFHK